MPLATGTRLGPYEVEAAIGAGGMGEVYKARDTRLDRSVAIKVLPAATLTDEAARARLLREARTASRLNHPNICTIHEVGEAEGQLYVAMELVDGRPLSHILESGPLPLHEVLRCGGQLSDALHHAHAHGVIHRDFKSANVVITPDGRAKVLDFGLAKRMGGDDATRTVTRMDESLTAPGSVVGTIAYMAPEQLRGEPADARSDIWALGVVLYEMAAGARPFRGRTGFELSSAILNQPAPPLPPLAGGLPPQPLGSVVGRCLEKDPARRFQGASEVRAALDAVSAGVAPPRVRRAPARRRHLVALAAVALAAVVAALVSLDVAGLRRLMTGGSRQGPVARMAVLPFANLTGDPDQEYLADGFTQEMIGQLGRLHPAGLNVIARNSVMRYKKGDIPLDQIGRELGVDYILQGSARREANRVRITAELIHVPDRVQRWADNYERELAGILALQSDVAREVARQIQLVLTPAEERRLASGRQVKPEVYEAYLRGMFYTSQNTQDAFEKGMRYLHEAVALDPAEPLAYAWLAQGYVTLGHGGSTEQRDAFPRARAAAEQALTLQPDMPEAIGVLADVALYYEWDWARAEQLFRRALDLNPSVAATQYHYAWYLALFDRRDEAIAAHKRARDFDPLRAANTGWLGQLYNAAGRYDDAIVEARKALELNPRFSSAYLVLQRAYSAKKMHEDAIAAASRFAELDPLRGTPALSLAYAQAGRRDEAVAMLAKAPKHSQAWNQTAAAYFALGDKDAALDELEAAWKARWPTVPWVRVHGGVFDGLREEPRFQDLLRKMNLPR